MNGKINTDEMIRISFLTTDTHEKLNESIYWWKPFLRF